MTDVRHIWATSQDAIEAISALHILRPIEIRAPRRRDCSTRHVDAGKARDPHLMGIPAVFHYAPPIHKQPHYPAPAQPLSDAYHSLPSCV